MIVTLIARTTFNSEVAHDLTGWESSNGDMSAHGASDLSEFAGRACYQSWSKPNPATADNADYLGHILEVGHYSVLEHGSVSFYLQDVSRSLTHELVRHRHMSPSQLSQRFVKASEDTSPVVPPLYQTIWEHNPMLPIDQTQAIVERTWKNCLEAYDRLVEIWEERLRLEGVTGTELRKRAREAARCVLPNMTPTAMVLTANHRAWRHFLELRGSLHADAEIRNLAVEIYHWLVKTEPAIYQDIAIKTDNEGRYYLGEFGVPGKP